MSEGYGGERSSEDEFIEQLGLVDTDEIERARRLLAVYREAIVEVNSTENNPIEADAVKYSSHLVEDFGADSLGFLEVLEILQEKCDVDVPIEPFEDEAVDNAGKAFVVLYGLVKDDLKGKFDGPEGDGPESGDREPRNPLPSDQSGSVMKDLLF